MCVVETSLLLQLLVVVVLNPLWSLLVLLILLFGDFGLRFLVSFGFERCRSFWPVVLSVVISFVALYMLVWSLVVVGLLKVAGLLKLIGGLLVHWPDEIAMLRVLRLHLRGWFLVSV